MSRSSFSLFLLVISFGILFAGCSVQKPEPDASFEEFSFTDTDLTAVQEKLNELSSASGSSSTLPSINTGDSPVLSLTTSGAVSVTVPRTTFTVDAAKKARYDAMRATVAADGSDIYRVNNAFVNVRSDMSTVSTQIARLSQGELVTVLSFPNAEWAHVRLSDGREGYVAFRYIAKLTTEEKFSEEKKRFEGQFFVNFQFLNVRKEPTSQAEKIGELPGHAILKPLSMNSEWAKVTADGREGYVSTTYLEPFLPVFLVRQDSYTLPILRYNAADTQTLAELPKHMSALKAAQKKIVTLKTLFDTVQAQESKDTRIAPSSVALTIVGVTAATLQQVTSVLKSAGVPATLFVVTKDLGITGITEKALVTMVANGYDIQSAGHTGDDLRSLTDSQVELEVQQSKKLLEDSTGKEVYVLSYPRGGVNDRVMSRAADAGYLFGLSESPDNAFTRGQFLRLPSIFVSSGMSPDDVVKAIQ